MLALTVESGRCGPWNKGKLVGQKSPLKLKEIWAIRVRLELSYRKRELALFNLAIDSKLRGCDCPHICRRGNVPESSKAGLPRLVWKSARMEPIQCVAPSPP